MAEPVLVVFDIDGTLAQEGPPASDTYADDRLLSLEPVKNMIAIAKKYIATEHVDIMFCTGRPKRSFRSTWQWLNKHLQLATSGKRIHVCCRPDDMPENRIADYKLGEIVQAVRRMGSKPSEALVFDDNVMNLQMFETIRPMVHRLRLYKVENGLASNWSL